MKSFQFVVFKYDWNAEQTLCGQYVDQRSLKRDRSFGDTRKVGSAEEHVIPKGNGLIFRNFNVGESQEKTLKKWSTGTRLEVFECVNDKIDVGVIWTHARGYRDAGWVAPERT